MPRVRAATSRRPGAARLGLALLALGFLGLGLLARPPHGFWPLGLVALAPLAWLGETRRPLVGFALAWLGWTLLGLLVGRDLLHALSGEYGVPWPSALAFSAVLVGAYATLPALASGLYAALRGRCAAWAAPLLFAALLIASEWLRSDPLALPWVLAGDAFARQPWLLQTAEWGGMHGVGLLAALSGGATGIALARRRAAPLAVAVLAFALALGWAAVRLPAPLPGGPEFEVGVVQAAVPQRQRFQPGSALRNTRRHAELTRALVAQRDAPPQLVVWSETAVDQDLDRDPRLLRELESLVAETRVPLLTGAPRTLEGAAVNAAVLFRPGAPPVSYRKQRLVPFAEGAPKLGGFLAPLVKPLLEGAGYAAGREATVLPLAETGLAAPICFEISYPALLRRFRAGGAGLIVNLTNDAWFGRGPYAGLHFQHAIFRAVELRSWVVRAANTGISGVIDPHGRVVAELPLFEEGVLRARVRATHARSFYGRLGDGPLLALCAGLAALALASGRRPRS